MPRGRSAGYGEQREAIVARAAELFARQGYHATSMNQLAEAAGLSKATLYHYYRDKDALLVHIADGHVSRLQALVAEAARVLPPRKATKPTLGSQKRRLESKTRRGATKRLRGGRMGDE